MTAHPLDNAVWHSLVGAHEGWAEAVGSARRYRADTSVFAALPDRPGPDDWADLARLVGPDGDAVLFRAAVERPPGWVCTWELPGVQLVAPPGLGRPADDVVPLTAADRDEATALVTATRPGPWRPRTIELGRYVGIRRGGRLVALAGERLRPGGHVELSAVCTATEARGQGLASRLVLHLVAGIEADGAVPFIQAAADNHPAVRLYEALGFRHRREVTVEVVRPEPTR